MPQKTWAIQEEVLAVDFNSYVQNQVVAQFASAAQRSTQWPAPPVGACSHLADSPGVLWVFSAGAWRSYAAGGLLITAANNTATNVPVAPSAIDLPGMTGSVTVPANRRIRIQGNVQFGVGAGTPGQCALQITDGANAQLRIRTANLPASNSTVTIAVSHVATPAAGTFTWKLRGFSNTAGATTIFAQDNSFSIEDVGGI
jgi:hypothetical protein